jgi:hypothetical protein
VDFVVVGFGFGALGVLLGVVMLGWLAPRSQRAAARVSAPDAAARHRAVAAEHRVNGQAFLYAGGAMLLATVAGLVGSLDDRTGAFLVTTTATVAAVGILLGGYLQRARSPVPLRRRTRSAAVASASIVTTPPPVDTPSSLADEYPPAEDHAPVERDVEPPLSGDFPAADSPEEAIVVEQKAPLAASANGAFSGATDPGRLGDSRIAAETTESGSWHPADRTAGNGSGDTDVAETENAEKAGYVAPAARTTESSPSQPDDEDPSSGHQS